MAVKKEIRKLADIAELAGVTAATVSRALSGHAQISPETRRKVMEIADTHGFRVNQAARNLRLGRTQSIGVIIPLGHESAQRVSDPFYTALIGHLMDGLAQRDHAMLLSAVDPHDPGWLDSLSRSGRVDGIIVLCQSDQEAALRKVGRSYKPLVVWGETAGVDGDYCCVGTDNEMGGRLATEHLLRLGKRRIAFAGMTDIPELAARHAGYLRAHQEHGISPGPQIPVPLSFDPRLTSLGEALSANTDIDAVVAASDVIAMEVIRAIVESDRQVPDDIAVVGYDDVTLAAHITPALTTIRQDLSEAAQVMLDLLFKRIAGEATDSICLPLDLVHRRSA